MLTVKQALAALDQLRQESERDLESNAACDAFKALLDHWHEAAPDWGGAGLTGAVFSKSFANDLDGVIAALTKLRDMARPILTIVDPKNVFSA